MIQSNNAGSRIDVRPWLIKSNVSGTSYSQQLKIKPSWIFLFWFHNRYNTALFLQWIRFHQVCWCFPFMSIWSKGADA
jgi:hypothetical protein